MISTLKFFGILGVIAIVLYPFLPVVTVLPYGMDEALVFFVGSIKAILQILPWLQIVWDLFILALFIKSLLFIFNSVRWFVELFAQS